MLLSVGRQVAMVELRNVPSTRLVISPERKSHQQSQHRQVAADAASLYAKGPASHSLNRFVRSFSNFKFLTQSALFIFCVEGFADFVASPKFRGNSTQNTRPYEDGRTLLCRKFWFLWFVTTKNLSSTGTFPSSTEVMRPLTHLDNIRVGRTP